MASSVILVGDPTLARSRWSTISPMPTARPATTSSPVTHALLGRSITNAGATPMSNYAGVVDKGGRYSHVAGSWIVPTVTVTRLDRYASDWVGIGATTT